MVPSGPFFLSSNSLDNSLRKCPQWNETLKTKARKGHCLYPLLSSLKLPEKGKQGPTPCLTGGQQKRKLGGKMCRKIILLQWHLCFCPMEGPFSSETPLELPLWEINLCPSAPRHQGNVQDSSSYKLNTWREGVERAVWRGCFSLGSFVSISSWMSYQWLKSWTFHIKSRYLAFLRGENTQTVKILNLYFQMATLGPSRSPPFSGSTRPLVSHRTQYPSVLKIQMWCQMTGVTVTVMCFSNCRIKKKITILCTPVSI